MYLSDDREVDLFEAGRWSEIDGGKELGIDRRRELRGRARKRREEATKKVHDTVAHWVRFYKGHESYFEVGTVKHRDLSGEPVRRLCEAARRKKQPDVGN